MPIKRKKLGTRAYRLLILAFSAAIAGGIIACLLGALLQERGLALAEKYSVYRTLAGSFSLSDIKAAMEKRGSAAR